MPFEEYGKGNVYFAYKQVNLYTLMPKQNQCIDLES